MFGLIKTMLISIDNVKCVSLSNQKRMTQSTLIILHPIEYSQEFHYYPFVDKLDRCVGSCNTLNDFTS